MADNIHRYGIRWNRAANGRDTPNPIPKTIATGYQATNDGAGFNVDLNIGDPVKLVSTGTVALALTTNDVFGIIVAFGPYWTGEFLKPTSRLPGATAWGTIRERKSVAMVVPVDISQFWEMDCDDKVTATTEGAYEAFEGENANVVIPGDNTDSSKPTADPFLDISSHAVTAGLTVRLEKVSPTVENQDFAGLYVKYLIRFNKTQSPAQAATTIVGV
jgi:hypothetical protein